MARSLWVGHRHYQPNNRSHLHKIQKTTRPLADQHVADPQSWNLYSYTRNNPLAFADVDGFEIRKPELAAAKQQIGTLSPGSRYTIAFMGVTPDGRNYLSGKNPTAVPGYSNELGLGELNGTNTAILSNSNGWINALPGDVDQDQVDTANAIYGEADKAGLKVDILTHSNGVAGAGAFAPGKEINNAVVVAPNTRSVATMTNIVNASSQTTIVQSTNDFALNIPGAAHKAPSVWSRIFKGNQKVRVIQTTQRGHRLRPYNESLNSGDADDITQE